MTEEEELAIIRRVVDGEIEAFEVLVTTYQRSLVRMLAALLHDRRRFAEEVAQDVLVEAFRRLSTFDSARSRFSTWLFMIARSRGINALKRKRPVLLADPAEAPGLPIRQDHHRAEEREEFARLDEAIHQLPAGQKRAFLMAALEELPYAEIARIEGTTVGTIKSRVSRARATLRTILERPGP